MDLIKKYLSKVQIHSLKHLSVHCMLEIMSMEQAVNKTDKNLCPKLCITEEEIIQKQTHSKIHWVLTKEREKIKRTRVRGAPQLKTVPWKLHKQVTQEKSPRAPTRGPSGHGLPGT